MRRLYGEAPQAGGVRNRMARVRVLKGRHIDPGAGGHGSPVNSPCVKRADDR